FVAEVHAAPDAIPNEPPSSVATPQDSRPSIAVLPFRLVGNPGPYASIADALPHDLIAELSRVRWLFVTARGSSFRLRTPDIDTIDVGRLLGVRYCATGTVEVARAGLAVTVELTDTRDGGIVWAGRFAGSLDDVHAFRDRNPAPRGAARAPHGHRGPRRLVSVSPRFAAHVPLQPQGQRRGRRIVHSSGGP